MRPIFCQPADQVKGRAAPPQTQRGQNRLVADKSPEDREANARIRAWLRQVMDERGIDPAELARRVGAVSPGKKPSNFYRQMDGSRPFNAGMILRICEGCQLTPTRLLEENPDPRFWDISPIPPPRRTRATQGR